MPPKKGGGGGGIGGNWLNPPRILLSRTSGLFRLAGRGRATLTRKSMPSRVLATVRSCMNGLFGSRLRSSRFICHKVSTPFSSTISLRQFRISSSIPWRCFGHHAVTRSRHYGSCCRPVHSKTVRDKQAIFSIVVLMGNLRSFNFSAFLMFLPEEYFEHFRYFISQGNLYADSR